MMYESGVMSDFEINGILEHAQLMFCIYENNGRGVRILGLKVFCIEEWPSLKVSGESYSG